MAKQSLDAFLTAHEKDADWPILREVDDRGRPFLACRGCGEELPDGVAVEAVGRSKARAVTYADPPPPHEWPDGKPPGRVVAEVVHECGGRS